MSRRGENETPILQSYRQTYVKVSCKIVDITEARLNDYIRYVSAKSDQEPTIDDVFEHALRLFFERDAGFKTWLKRTSE